MELIVTAGCHREGCVGSMPIQGAGESSGPPGGGPAGWLFRVPVRAQSSRTCPRAMTRSSRSRGSRCSVDPFSAPVTGGDRDRLNSTRASMGLCVYPRNPGRRPVDAGGGKFLSPSDVAACIDSPYGEGWRGWGGCLFPSSPRPLTRSGNLRRRVRFLREALPGCPSHHAGLTAALLQEELTQRIQHRKARLDAPSSSGSTTTQAGGGSRKVSDFLGDSLGLITRRPPPPGGNVIVFMRRRTSWRRRRRILSPGKGGAQMPT